MNNIRLIKVFVLVSSFCSVYSASAQYFKPTFDGAWKVEVKEFPKNQIFCECFDWKKFKKKCMRK